MKMWETVDKKSGDRKNLSYRFPAIYGCILLEADIDIESVLYLKLFFVEDKRVVEVKIVQASDGLVGSEELKKTKIFKENERYPIHKSEVHRRFFIELFVSLGLIREESSLVSDQACKAFKSFGGPPGF